MKNRLISDKVRERYLRDYNLTLPEERASGRTLGLAIYYIGLAMTNPGTVVTVEDHWNTRASNIGCTTLVADIKNKLGLKFLDIDINRGTIIYSVFDESSIDVDKELKKLEDSMSDAIIHIWDKEDEKKYK